VNSGKGSMKPRRYQWLVIFWMLPLFHASAATLYVDLNSTNPTPPYAGWSTAATNIQDAVDAASAGDTVFVTNGIYATGGRMWFDSGTNRVTLTNAITLQSVNGPAVTFIVGNKVAGTGSALTNAVRCVLIGNAVLSGFTLTNGEAGTGNYPNGGGVDGGGGGTVTNCVLTGNLSTNGVGGGAYRATLINCQIIGNYASQGGGACNCTLINCTVVSNTASSGGGVFGGSPYGPSLLSNCTIAGNSATSGGGVYGAALTNCALLGNFAQNGGGMYQGSANNCVIISNTASVSGGGAYGGMLFDSTLVANAAGNSGGGVYGGSGAWLYNSIAYYNSAPTGANLIGAKDNYCCAAPTVFDTHSITNEPLFVNASAGDFRLQSISPCINAGNNSYVTNTTDLDGNPRIVGGTVDIGAYEFQSPIHYVNVSNATPVSPFTNWTTAATNIQDAVDASTNGDLVLVTNGIYQTGGRELNNTPPTNRVTVTKTITLMSANGPSVTVIKGYQMPGSNPNGASAIRCVYLTNGAVLAGFTLTNGASYSNPAGGLYNLGGAVFCQSTNNMLPVSTAVVSNCMIIGNSSAFDQVAYGGRLDNCVLAFNSGGAYDCILNNCAVVSNSASFLGGGIHFCTASNCIVYYNTAPSNPNSWGSTFAYCCTTPLPASGVGNITNEPAFVNLAGGDFHLQSNSPCINAGNNSSVTYSNDLDGNPRIVGGTVDIGAYEYQTPTSILSYAWAQQYGLPTDGSADFIDSDGDGMNNWQEWIAGTDPTNPLSVLKMLAPASTKNPSGLVVSWQSVINRTYYLQRGGDLSAQPVFSTIQSNIIGQAVITSYTDTTATNGGPYFYRAGVQ
jgi:hypothetical protein